MLDEKMRKGLLHNAVKIKATNMLAERFVVPPFSQLEVKQGCWMKRKKAWVALGLESDVGRPDDLTYPKDIKQFDHYRVKEGKRKKTLDQGTSMFDPVLCECAYRWWCPPNGVVLDPFAGGSVRGIVAAVTERNYIGIDLRREQIDADYKQGHDLLLPDCLCGIDDLTPVEKKGGVFFKRDDKFAIAGVCGGKVRAAYAILQKAKEQGASVIITAGARQSPQVMIVSTLAAYFGIPCRCHVPEGQDTREINWARLHGADVIKHKPGYNTVIIARAREDAEKTEGGFFVPFGMEDQEAVEQARKQVANLPFGEFNRIVMSVGSGMSLAGVLWGLKDAGHEDIRVLGVVVGADPRKRLNKYAPPGWDRNVTLVESKSPYQQEVKAEAPVRLDPVYEAKAWGHALPDDLFWIVGHHESPCKHFPIWHCGDSLQMDKYVKTDVDFLFSCPPYGDLEQYSDLENDLSNMPREKFLEVYREIIFQSVRRLKDNRFACFVVADYRDKKTTFYHPFTSDTISIFQDAGLRLYNKAVLATIIGTAAVRATRLFEASRKLVKIHQDVLVFCKGDWKKATLACKGKTN